MLYVSRKKGNKYGIVDTEDWVEEFYTKEELRGIHKLGLKIRGITDTGVKIVNWEQEPEYIKAKTLLYQLEITQDNKVKVVSKPEDLPIPKFCCLYEYHKNLNGLMVMSGEYIGGNLVIPEFVNKLKINWGNHKKVTLSGGSGLVTLEECFSECVELEEVCLSNLDVSNVKEMGNMFWFCYNLQNLDSLRNWDVSNVENMKGIFEYCRSLQNLNGLRNWDVSKVKNMKNMFSGCKKLQNIDGLMDWNVSNVEVIHCMFDECEKLQNLDGLSNWDVSNVEDMSYMFCGCYKLQNIAGLRNWNVSNVENMDAMFSDCDNLQNIDSLRNWNVSNVEDVKMMFLNYKNLQSVDILRNWGVSNV